MNVHEMKLKEVPFDLIKNGTKIIEVRLFDEKRQAIKIGDKIIFSKLPDLEEKITVEVKAILLYPDFKGLFTDFPSSMFGASGWSVDEQVKNMHQYYSEDEVEKYGVVGIKLKLI